MFGYQPTTFPGVSVITGNLGATQRMAKLKHAREEVESALNIAAEVMRRQTERFAEGKLPFKTGDNV